MRRTLAYIASGLLILCVVLFGAAYWYVANPPADRDLALPDGTVSLESPRGQRWLEESVHRTDYELLDAHLNSQIHRSYCGVATSDAVFDATGASVEQASLFEQRPHPRISSWNVFFSGMTLGELATLFRHHGFDVAAHHAGDSSVDAFRRAAERNLSTPNDYLLVNYHRKTAEQQGGGHISPVAAYHAETDRVLVLDTATYKYPPFWIEVDRLFEAMETRDAASGRTRGYVLVEAPARGEANGE